MAKRSYFDGPTSGNPANIKLEGVRPMWLEVSETERYLFLEDPETGDVLMPLIYMKALLEANYSRKLASLKHRVVNVPRDSSLASRGGHLYWHWAFESPQSVKGVVRKELGEENTPQGHLRVVLLPIVYNALSAKASLRCMPLFAALHGVMRQSTYYPLLHPPPSEFLGGLEARLAREQPPARPLFHGPARLEATASKYMFMFGDADGDAGAAAAGAPGPAKHARAATETDASSANAPGSGSEPGPGPGASLRDADADAADATARDLLRTLAAGASGGAPFPVPHPSHRATPNHSPERLLDASASTPADEAGRPRAARVSVLEAELRAAREELAIMKQCILQLYGIVLGVDGPGQLGGEAWAAEPTAVNGVAPGSAFARPAGAAPRADAAQAVRPRAARAAPLHRPAREVYAAPAWGPRVPEPPAWAPGLDPRQGLPALDPGAMHKPGLSDGDLGPVLLSMAFNAACPGGAAQTLPVMNDYAGLRTAPGPGVPQELLLELAKRQSIVPPGLEAVGGLGGISGMPGLDREGNLLMTHLASLSKRLSSHHA